MLARTLEQRQRFLRLARAQVRVREIDLVARVFLRERRGPMREVRLERGDRVVPLRGVVPVMTQEKLGVVARRILRDDLREQRHTGVRIAREHELAAERAQHLGIRGRELLRLAHQRDAVLVLLLRRVDRRAQHVRLDPPRVERERLIERLRGVVELAATERRATFLDEARALVLALVRALRERRRGEREQHDEPDASTHSPPSGTARGPRPVPGTP
jgi:hypothetical protein